MTEGTPAPYPARLTVEYTPVHDRWTVFFRIFYAVPIIIVWALLFANGGGSSDHGCGSSAAWGAGFVFLPALLMIVFRQKYPRWWYDWNLNLMRFGMRVTAFVLLLRDEYPSTDEEQAVRADFPYPDARAGIDRWLPLVKWLLAFPHYVCLAGLGVAVAVFTVVSWFAILFTGTYPRPMFDLVAGTMRWGLRVGAYAFLLVTDEYPPFRLSE
ncbi:MAG: DUF4389 domain-containing protein [Candidatus Edwardsbacteria bacterium]|jgi:hypothetical protein|nr:DUF4389 domain-containing protein [Candidatus Edwardsbacteria bacterium]